MAHAIDAKRRRFLGAAAMTIAAGPLGMFSTVNANDGGSRELAAISGAAEWLNSPVRQMAIEYSVVIDNDYSIWRAFKNQYWHALYFVDARARVREHHFGEGEHEQSELTIRRLLREAGVAEHPRRRRVGRCEGRGGAGGLGQLEVPGKLHRVRADGTSRVAWWFGTRFGVGSMLPLRAWRSINGRWQPSGRWAGRPPSSAVPTGKPRLYQLIRQPKPIVDRQFEIEFLDAGVETFAFTFG
jgi:Thioredoxin like C-terminal domain